ncbi:MAG: bifunctional nuclease family protein [Acidobacteriota bacterium]|nr:bifunctional nuclease family protein [Acidobacteriota bacterium]MDE3108016.1 bifunctional nuclease family protein [Acidobacteriota bacterium]MDE3223153.1 bifunctional nuclease family protein [Acidobacteriota bacterium]
MIEVVLRAVRVDVGSSTPLLLLEEVQGSRVLPIYVGAPEAAAIAYALQGVSAPRPMTHDLLGNVITSLDARLFSVEITDLVDNTFFATLRLLRDQREILISARPSDAVALALRVGAPILVVDELMAREGKILELSYEDDDESEGLEPFDATSEAELVAQFEEFLDQVKPEDFDA